MCILQGPVAAKYSVVKDEPTKLLFGNVVTKLASSILERYYQADDTHIDPVPYLGYREPNSTTPAGMRITEDASSTSIQPGDSLPSNEEWLEYISIKSAAWLQALLTSRIIVQGRSYVENPLRRVFVPRHNQTIVLRKNAWTVDSIVIRGAARSHGTHDPSFESVVVNYEKDSHVITVTISEERKGVSVPLNFTYQYRPDQGYMPIHELVEDRNRRIKAFYWKLWFGESTAMPVFDVHSRFVGLEVKIQASEVKRFALW